MNDILMAIIGGGVGAALVSIIGTYILNRQLHRYELEKEDSLERKALKALLHDRIYESCTKILSEGSVTTDEYKNLQFLYEPYKELNGNSVAKKLIEAVDKLMLYPEKKGD